jgi:predicted nucleic acid-binding protein
MTTGDGDPVFLDTNALIYASVPEAPLHVAALSAIKEQAGAELWISRQVLREFLAVLTRPQSYGAPVPALLLAAQIRFFERYFRVAEDSAEITARLLMLLDRIPIGGKQVHDANIVATMQAYGVRRLLTHNTADFARFAGLISVVPLVASR